MSSHYTESGRTEEPKIERRIPRAQRTDHIVARGARGRIPNNPPLWALIVDALKIEARKTAVRQQASTAEPKRPKRPKSPSDAPKPPIVNGKLCIPMRHGGY